MIGAHYARTQFQTDKARLLYLIYRPSNFCQYCVIIFRNLQRGLRSVFHRPRFSRPVYLSRTARNRHYLNKGNCRIGVQKKRDHSEYFRLCGYYYAQYTAGLNAAFMGTPDIGFLLQSRRVLLASPFLLQLGAECGHTHHNTFAFCGGKQ